MLRDLRYAFRTLRQNPGFSLTAVLSIALAIGANSTLFSFQNGLLLRPLAIEKPSEVVTINARTPTGAVDGLPYPDFAELHDKNHSFVGMFAYRLIATGISRDAESQPEFKPGLLVSGNVFDLLGVKPALGRGFRMDEDQVVGRDAVVVLGHDYWKSEWSGDPSIVGRHIRLGVSATNFTVIGVAPESFTGIDLFVRPAFYIPVSMAPRVFGLSDDFLKARNQASKAYDFMAKARLKPGVSLQAASADIASIAQGLASAFPDSNRGRTAVVRSEIQARIDNAPILQGVAASVFGLMVLILLIACANVMILMLGRARSRAREIGVRLAIGATRARLVRQLLAESLAIAISGGLLGLMVAGYAVGAFADFDVPGDIPIKLSFQLDLRVLAFTAVVSVVSAILFGLVPALYSVRVNLVGTMKGEDFTARSRQWGRNALVGVQITGSLVMLMAAGQMYRNAQRVLTENPGFLREQRLAISLDPSLAGYTPQQSAQFYDQLIEKARNTAGIRSAALGAVLPLASETMGVTVAPEDFQLPAGERNVTLRGNLVDENYFSTLGVPIVEGRSFRSTDTANSPKVVIVNQDFAQRFFAGKAIGKRIRLDNQDGAWAEIVGLTATGKYVSVAESPAPYVYLAYRQYPLPRMKVIVETLGDPLGTARPLRALIRDMDPQMPIFSIRTMEDVFQHGTSAQLRIFTGVFAISSLMGFILSVVGLYAVVAYQVTRRTREIGVRIALGADKVSVLTMVLRQAALVAGIGIGVGLLLSVVVRPALLVSVGRPVSPYDPLMLFGVPLSLLLTALAAAAIPARRASRIDPQQALREN